MPSPNGDKDIVSNRSALDAKYGAPKANAIYAALNNLIAADKKRGHATIIIDIDDSAQMNQVGGSAVINVKDARGAPLGETHG